MIRIILLNFIFLCISEANVLQSAIDKAPVGAVLTLPNGVYTGKIVINKALTIQGKEDRVTIQGDGKGTVITVNSSNVVLENLHITGSGDRMEKLDAAIALHHVRQCKISHCRISESLYGIDMNRVEDSIISDNDIRSKKNTIPLRGDALKIWYARNNLIKNNTIAFARDVTLTYSNHNSIEGNTFLHNRFGLHLSMSHNNSIKNNTFQYNSVGILLMGVKDTNVTYNKILSSDSAAGIGVVADKVSNFHLEHNSIKYNAKALYINAKATEKGKQRFIKYNVIAYNNEALHFHTSIKNNVITHNIIKDNLDDVVKDTRDGYTKDNLVAYNYWDRYVGFDRNRDNIGDTPYQNYIYSDQLWQYNHHIKFFYGTPIMSMINFLAKIAPFIQPVLLLEDTKPLMHIKGMRLHQRHILR